MKTVAGLTLLPPLSAEVERELLPLIVRGREAQQRLVDEQLSEGERRRLRRLVSAGSDAESTLLHATLGLVRRRVRERGFSFESEDLELAGVEGLVNALRRFEPSKGNRFSTYAYPWITKLVNQAIRQKAGFSEHEMALILQLQKLLRSDVQKHFGVKEIAAKLGISVALAREVVEMNHRFVHTAHRDVDYEAVPAKESTVEDEAPAWVIDELRRLCGDDFTAFWHFAHKIMTVEELAYGRGISRQAMAKRLEKCRKAVRNSPEAQRLQDWLTQQ